jgi:hypothetical protein
MRCRKKDRQKSRRAPAHNGPPLGAGRVQDGDRVLEILLWRVRVLEAIGLARSPSIPQDQAREAAEPPNGTRHSGLVLPSIERRPERDVGERQQVDRSVTDGLECETRRAAQREANRRVHERSLTQLDAGVRRDIVRTACRC